MYLPRPLVNIQFCGEPPWLRGSVLDLRPQGYELFLIRSLSERSQLRLHYSFSIVHYLHQSVGFSHVQLVKLLLPTNTELWPNAGSMLVHRLRRWPNINSALSEHLMCTGSHLWVVYKMSHHLQAIYKCFSLLSMYCSRVSTPYHPPPPKHTHTLS